MNEAGSAGYGRAVTQNQPPLPASVPGVGAPPWPGGPSQWPQASHYDPQLLELGDRRNVEDRYRYWRMEAIVGDLDRRNGQWLEVAIENLSHDFNIGSIVRTANSFGVRRVHIVGRRRWNRRGAMVTDRYLHVLHHASAADFAGSVRARGLAVVGIDNTDGSLPLEVAKLARQSVLVMGEESAGLSEAMRLECEAIYHITQYGSSRSMNVGHAAAIAMYSWALQHAPRQP